KLQRSSLIRLPLKLIFHRPDPKHFVHRLVGLLSKRWEGARPACHSAARQTQHRIPSTSYRDAMTKVKISSRHYSEPRRLLPLTPKSLGSMRVGFLSTFISLALDLRRSSGDFPPRIATAEQPQHLQNNSGRLWLQGLNCQ